MDIESKWAYAAVSRRRLDLRFRIHAVPGASCAHRLTFGSSHFPYRCRAGQQSVRLSLAFWSPESGVGARLLETERKFIIEISFAAEEEKYRLYKKY